MALGAQSEGLHRGQTAGQQAGDHRIFAVGQYQSVAGHDVDDLPEGALDLAQILVDVGVVELDVADDQHLGQVVEELEGVLEEKE